MGKKIKVEDLLEEIWKAIDGLDGKLPKDIEIMSNFKRGEKSKGFNLTGLYSEDIIFVKKGSSKRSVEIHACRENEASEILFEISFHYKEDDNVKFYNANLLTEVKHLRVPLETAFSEKFIRKCASWVRSGALYPEYFLNL